MDVLVGLVVLALALYGAAVLLGKLGSSGREAAPVVKPRNEVQRSRAAAKPDAVPSKREAGLPPHRDLIRLSSDGRVAVVGESHYQPAIAAAAQGRNCQEWQDAVETTAILVPEPTNPYDRNAVRITLSGRTVGYLSREEAVQYQPQLLDLLQAGRLGSCPAYVCGGGDRYYGVFLHLGRPGCLVPVNSADGLELLAAERQVTVTGEEGHQDVLAGLAAQARGAERLPVFASLHRCTVGKGKYAGQDGIEVRIDGSRVGELTKLQSDRYLPTVATAEERAGPVGCEASLTWSEKGWQVELQLPRPADPAGHAQH
jgi:hypothetical protein